MPADHLHAVGPGEGEAIWFLQTLLHECGHAVIPAANGCSISIKPYPHTYNGQFYFARSSWS